MKTKSLLPVALLGATLMFSTNAMAGPEPGKYRGQVIRTAREARVRALQWLCIVIASNPAIPSAAYSTRVTSTSHKGTSERLNYTFQVQDNGNVEVEIEGKVKLADGIHQFRAAGIGIGSFTATSFATKIEYAELSGPGDATITVSAGSPTPGNIEVELLIKPTKKKHPLGRGYRAKFLGKAQS